MQILLKQLPFINNVKVLLPSFNDLTSTFAPVRVFILFILSLGNKNCINIVLIFISKSSGLSLSLKSAHIDLGSYKSKALPIDKTFSFLSPDAIHTFIPAPLKRDIEYFKYGSIFSSKKIIPKNESSFSYSIANSLRCSSLFTT